VESHQFPLEFRGAVGQSLSETAIYRQLRRMASLFLAPTLIALSLIRTHVTAATVLSVMARKTALVGRQQLT
jgi:hypothetical protein